MQTCSNCKRIHIGSLIFASPGFQVLFLSDWEACCNESDLDFQLRNALPLIKMTDNLVRFIELAN